MSIQLYAAGYCHDSGKATQRSGIAALLIATDEFGRKVKRVISHPIGASTRNVAEINALRLALSSVKKKFRKQSEVTLLSAPQAISYLEIDDTGSYEKNSRKYNDELQDLRRWAGYYNNLSCEPVDDELLAECIAEAKLCADNQKPKDTRTQHVDRLAESQEVS